MIRYFRLAVRNVSSRRLRSFLTILGIIIALTLITSLFSLGEGLRLAVLKQLRMLGDRTFYIFPGEETNPFLGLSGGLVLKESDVERVKTVKGVGSVVPMFTRAMVMEFQGEKKLASVCGHPWGETIKMLEEFEGWRLAEGKWPRKVEGEVVLGYKVAKKNFSRALKAGDKIKIGEREFKISGILRDIGTQNFDIMVSIDLSTLRAITGEKEAIQMMITQVNPDDKIDKVVSRVKKELKKGREVEDFAILTNKKIMGVVGNVMGIVEGALLGIAAIALVVGGIGIMTTMYTSVYERTKEIGIMKALGAKNRNVMAIFLIESGILGFLGGALGLTLGMGIAKTVEIIAVQRGFVFLQAIVTPLLILSGLSFSFLVGCISGFLPARRAARLNPVESLRHE